MGSFSWLHLTDFHLGIEGQGYLWPNVRHVFLENLAELHDRSGPWHAVLFTGDFVQQGSAEEFRRLDSELLGPLRDRLERLGSTPLLLGVPGNHDLMRPGKGGGSDRRLTAAERFLMTPGMFYQIAEEFWTNPACEFREVIGRAFENYWQWWRELSRTGSSSIRSGIMPGDFSHTLVTADGLQIGVVGVNTAFLQLAAGDFTRRLAWDVRQLHAVCDGDAASWANRHDACILLTHHGPEWLDKQSREQVYPEINPAGRFAVHLFGHMHKNVSRSIWSGGGKPVRLWQGRSLFGLEYYGEGQEEDRSHGYSAGRIDLQEPVPHLRHWPRRALRDPVSGWRFVRDEEGCALDDDGGTRPEPIERQPAARKPRAAPQPMQMADLVKVECIKCPLDATTPEEAIDELVDLLATQSQLPFRHAVAGNIKMREAQLSTHVSPGIALPHPKDAVKGVRKKYLAIGRTGAPIPWPSICPEVDHVELIFLFVPPEGERGVGARILDLLGRTLGDEIVSRRLKESKTAVDLYNTLGSVGIDLGVPPGLSLKRTTTAPHSDVIQSLAWSPNGQLLASGAGGTERVQVVDAESGSSRVILHEGSAPIYSVAWSPDGKLLAAGGEDRMIRVWDTDGFPLRTEVESPAQIYALAWSPDGRDLASAGHTFTVRVWDADTLDSRPGYEGTLNTIGYCVAWSPDGRWLAAGSGRMEPAVKVWNAATRRLEKTLVVQEGSIFTLAWSPKGKVLAAGTFDGFILVYEANTWRELRKIRAHAGQLTRVDFSCDGALLASKADDGTVRLWNAETWEPLAVLSEPGEMHRLFAGLAFHPKDLTLATLGQAGRSIRIWELNHEEMIDDKRQPQFEVDARSRAASSVTLEQRRLMGQYDVFLYYNVPDRTTVMTIGRRLKDRGILPWLDEWNAPPGKHWLDELAKHVDRIRAVAVFIGKDNIGPWQRQEFDKCMNEFVGRKCAIIPVILPDCSVVPALPPILNDWGSVDFRKSDPDPMAQLIWGITGERPHNTESTG